MAGYPYSNRKVIKCVDTGEVCSGDKYLNTKHWKAIRIKAFEYYNGVCQRCGDYMTQNNFTIHHRSYKNLGNEKMTDLVLYCNRCHAIIHNKRYEGRSINATIQFMLGKLTPSEKERVAKYIANILGNTVDNLNTEREEELENKKNKKNKRRK